MLAVAVTINAFLPLLRQSPSPRIVNVSSGIGSLTLLSDPTFPFAALNNAAYQSSKTALNALTVLYAKDLGKDGLRSTLSVPDTERPISTAACRRLAPETRQRARRLLFAWR